MDKPASVVCSVTLALLVSAAAAKPPTRPAAADEAAHRIEVHGHRGARALRPENTLAAFEYALRVGVDVLELDLGVSADDRLVVLHDQRINPRICRRADGRPVGVDVAVRSLRLAQLQRLDCGGRRHPDFARQQPVKGARIPTLEQVLQLVRRSRHPAARTVQLNIETKLVPAEPQLSVPPARFVRLIVGALRRHKMLRRSMLQSFDHRTLAAAHKLAPRLRRVALIGKSLPDLVAVARAAGATTVSPNHAWITANAVKRLHRAGMRVVPWTANRPADWKRLVELKVDGIITDDPDGLIAYLKQRGLR